MKQGAACRPHTIQKWVSGNPKPFKLSRVDFVLAKSTCNWVPVWFLIGVRKFSGHEVAFIGKNGVDRLLMLRDFSPDVSAKDLSSS